jgi:two-component system sensor histidine kinase/response regulator
MADSARILVIESVTADPNWLSRLLSDVGYPVHGVPDLSRAVAVLARSPHPAVSPGLVVWQGTPLNGERDADFKAHLQRLDIPLLWLLPSDLAPPAVEAWAGNCLVDYVVAPHRPEDLIARVKLHLTYQARTAARDRARQQTDPVLNADDITQSAIFNAIPDLLLRLRADGTYLDRLSGRDVTHLPGTDCYEGQKVHDLLPPELFDLRLRHIEQALATGKMQRYKQQFELNGALHHEECRVIKLTDDEVLVIVRDITERELANQRLQQQLKQERAIAHITDQIHRSLELETIFKAVVHTVWETLACNRVLIYRFNPDWSGQIVAEAVSPEWLPLMPLQESNPALTQRAVAQADCLSWSDQGMGVTLPDTYIQSHQAEWWSQSTQVKRVEDIYQANFEPCYLDFLEQLQARAYLIVPIYDGEVMWGLLTLYQNDAPRQWQNSDVAIVSQTGTQLSIAVQQSELFQHIRTASLELAAAKEVAETASKAKSVFLANMSHELRTPMNAILGFAQLLDQDDALPKTQREYTQTILRSGEHLLGLINSVLDLSKIEAGRVDIAANEVRLSEFLQGVHAMLAQQAQRQQITLTLAMGDALPTKIRTDDGKLRQVLINLLGNAIKFTTEGGVTLRVFPASAPRSALGKAQSLAQTTLIFEVIDTGPGITPREQYRIFEAFEQTRTGQSVVDGTGLGLTISSRFVEMLGGNMMLCSTLGEGSTFRVSLPVEVVTEIAPVIQGNSPAREKVVGLLPGQRHYSILIADDNRLNRQIAMEMLSPLGFELWEAENGAEALSQWEIHQPDLILMDIRMPIMDGYDATEAIRTQAQALDPTRSVKIIAVTAAVLDQEPEKAIAAGCDDFLSKPVQLNQLIEKVGQHLGLAYRFDVLTAAPTPETTTAILQPQNLLVMSDSWIRSLHRTAVLCNDQDMETLIKQIPNQHQQLRQALLEKTQQLKFEVILELTEAALLGVEG